MNDSGLRVTVVNDGQLRAEDLGWRYGLGPIAGLPPAGVRLLGERTRLEAGELEGVHAVVVLSANVDVPAEVVERLPDLAVVARFGVGFDRVDTAACTREGVAVAITPAGPYRAVASGNLALMLALGHRVPVKEGILRAGGWIEAGDHLGVGLSGKTLGSVGLGRIGRETLRLVAPFGMTHLAYDPYLQAAPAGEDVELVTLDELARRSDFIVVNAALTPETRGLLGAEFFAAVKPTAFLVNLARGPIVDEAALVDALQAGRLAGAGLDVFETEPLPASSPLRDLPGLILGPHSLAATDELAAGNGAGVVDAVRAIAAGEAPADLANPDVRDSPRLAERLARVPRTTITKEQ